MSIWPCSSRHLSMTALIWSSDWTSHGSTNVDPIDMASGRTRFSSRLSTEEKPSVAPSSCRAFAMPQAIEWSFATPKISAFLPSSRPIGSSVVRAPVSGVVILRETDRGRARIACEHASISRFGPVARAYHRLVARTATRSPTARSTAAPADMRAALAGVRAFVLDADGVLMYRDQPIAGSPGALVELRRRGTPYRVVTHFSSAHRSTLA